MRERSQLLLGQSVRITWQLGDGKQPAWSQRISDRCQTPLGISHLAEDSHEERNIEGAGTKRQLDGIRVNVPDVFETGPAETSSSLQKHFHLNVDQFKSPVGNGLRHLDAEETRSWSDLQHARRSGEIQAGDESLG